MPVTIDHAGPGLFYHFPVLPAKLLLPTPLRPGTRISIQGTVPAEAARFAVNVQSGLEKASSAVLFHFNPRFKEGPVVVRNTRDSQGSWLQEERADTAQEFPFACQEDFRLVITPNEECFEVLVNDQPFVTYAHRLPLDSATHLVIKGDVFIRTITVTTDLPLKLLASIPQNLNNGDVVVLKGRVKDDAKRIKFNLQSNETDDADILVHVNPRFEENDLVLNSRIGGEWGSEHRLGSIPLQPGAQFTVAIAATPDTYKVLANGILALEYPHRIPLNTGKVLLVDGDVEILRVDIDSLVSFLPGVHRGESLQGTAPKVHVAHPNVPSAIDIPGGLAPGNVVIITGEPTKEPNAIRINLQAVDTDVNRSADDVSLHFNPRWDDGPAVVINSRQGGTWGNEERLLVDGTFPLIAGRHFDLIISVENDAYLLTIDGNVLGRVALREPGPGSAQSITLRGDVHIRRVLVF